jgi:arginine decarboxylase
VAGQERCLVHPGGVTPYPPGFPVLVPGQVFSPQILAFMRSLDTLEVHGYRPDLGSRVYLDKALEIAATAPRHRRPTRPVLWPTRNSATARRTTAG